MKPIRRILVVHPYGIGDFLFATPALRALRLLPGVECVDLLLGSRTEAVVRRNPHVDETFVVDKDHLRAQGKLKTWKELWTLGKKLRAKKYDLLLDYSLRSEYAFFSAFFLGIPRRAGFAYKRRALFHNIRVPLPEGFHGKHSVEHYSALAEKAGVPVEDKFMEFYLTPDDRTAAAELLRKKGAHPDERFLAVCPGGGESWGKDAHFKQWPVRFYAELIEKMRRESGFNRVLIFGSRGEKELAQNLADALSGNVINLAGETNILETAALIEKSELFVGNDGGLVHIAHALRVPLIAFYGPVDPEAYGPYPASPRALAIYKENLACRPCYKNFRYKSDCATRECLQDLQPDEVWLKLEQIAFLTSVRA